jgi:hypothetical protein
MACKPEFSAQSEFGRWVVSDLKHAGCGNQQLDAIALATVSTTIAFLRWNRREALATNPSSRQLAKQQFDFENALLRSVAIALPKPRKRGRRKDIDTINKFIRIVELDPSRTKWAEIEKALNAEFGAGGNADAYRKIYRRHLPLLLRLLLKEFLPAIPAKLFLPLALKAVQGRPGRPKTGRNSHR